MPEALVNGAASTLAASITNSQTTIPIQSADASKFPGTGNTYRLAVSDGTNIELMWVTAGQGTATLTVTRAVEAYNGVQTAFAFGSGATVAAVLTAAAFTTLVPASVLVQRRTSTPTNGVTVTGDNTAYHSWSTPWQITVTGVASGQHVLLRANAALSNGTNYGYIAFYRVTGGPTFLYCVGVDMNAHVVGVYLEYDDATPGTGSITYEVYGGANTGTVTLNNNGSSAFSVNVGNSLLVAEVYNP
jgi:hypothetical protein